MDADMARFLEGRVVKMNSVPSTDAAYYAGSFDGPEILIAFATFG
jgi:hypothetical protein